MLFVPVPEAKYAELFNHSTNIPTDLLLTAREKCGDSIAKNVTNDARMAILCSACG
jgi:hypothetical protein